MPGSASEDLRKLLRCGRQDDVLQPEVDEHIVVPQELVQDLHHIFLNSHLQTTTQDNMIFTKTTEKSCLSCHCMSSGSFLLINPSGYKMTHKG